MKKPSVRDSITLRIRQLSDPESFGAEDRPFRGFGGSVEGLGEWEREPSGAFVRTLRGRKVRVSPRVEGDRVVWEGRVGREKLPTLDPETPGNGAKWCEAFASTLGKVSRERGK